MELHALLCQCTQELVLLFEHEQGHIELVRDHDYLGCPFATAMHEELKLHIQSVAHHVRVRDEKRLWVRLHHPASPQTHATGGPPERLHPIEIGRDSLDA